MNREQKYVRVRIAVAVDVDGDWNASGWGSFWGAKDPEEAMSLAREAVSERGVTYWVEVDLPLPVVAVVEATRVEEV